MAFALDMSFPFLKQVDGIYNRISVIINLLDSGSLLNTPISFSSSLYTEPIATKIHTNILIVVDIINKIIFILTDVLQSEAGKKYLSCILRFFLEEASSMLETYKNFYFHMVNNPLYILIKH